MYENGVCVSSYWHSTVYVINWTDIISEVYSEVL